MPLPGAGAKSKRTTTLRAANSYSGATNVIAGTLRAGAPNTLSPNSAVRVAGGGTLDLNGFNQIVPGVINAGLVNMGTGTAPGTVLTTTSYIGIGVTIAIRFLGADGSPSDKSSSMAAAQSCFPRPNQTWLGSSGFANLRPAIGTTGL